MMVTTANPVRMKDIATMLGVSVSTVGRALANRPEISDAMKARVRELAEQHGYVAHSAARSMRTGHSSLIGLIVPDIRNDFYGASAMALAKCCEAAGFQLVLAATQDDPDSELRQVRGFIEARVAGVVIAPSAAPRRETTAMLARVPTVELIREFASRAWFGIDDRRGIETATKHLLDLGHRRIAYVGGEDRLSTGRERLAGFRAAFQAAGLDPPADLMRLGPPDATFGEQAFGDIWSGDNRPTALVTAGADLTVGALEAVGRLGVSVPGDLSIVGFGDAPWFRWWGKGLTTMALPVYDVAFACGDYLLRQIKEDAPETKGAPAYRAMHAPSLVVRGSTRHV
jgi:LacI family transcriptional regulator